jgi:fanconi anemia group J protein
MVISRSPKNHVLKATFVDSNQARFQDGVAQALQSIAQVVPDGMLVFMPSYGMLSKLYSRWQENGVLSILCRNLGATTLCFSPLMNLLV